MLFGAVSADLRDCYGNKCRKVHDSARKVGPARRASPAVIWWSTDCKEPPPAKQLKSYIASGKFGRGKEGVSRKGAKARRSANKKSGVFLRRQEPRLDPCHRRGTWTHGDQASFDLRDSSGEVAALLGGRAFGIERDRPRLSPQRVAPLDEQAAQRPPGIVGGNGYTLRKGVRAEGGHATVDAVGA